MATVTFNRGSSAELVDADELAVTPSASSMPLRLGSLFLTDDALMEEYQLVLKEDSGVELEAKLAAEEMRNTPTDYLDKRKGEGLLDDGKVSRRAPLNPIASPWLGKYRRMQGGEKAQDPALRNNPLRGRLLVTFITTFVLLFVFLQSLVLNYTETGNWIVSSSINPMFGPSPEVLQQLGGLDTNLIREGQTVRIFWAMWMHSGFIHIAFNVLSQFQFLYMFEPDWGFWRSLMVFWIAGVSGNILSAIKDPCSVTVGSSGSLYGLMGAMIIYCVEYWKTIPRPGCILIFIIIVVAISIVTGFTGNTDNWAHLGGLVGGFLFALMTIKSLTAFEDFFEHGFASFKKKKVVEGGGDDPKSAPSPPEGAARGNKRHTTIVVSADGKKKKKVVKRGKITQISPGVPPGCKCGKEEWIARTLAFLGLFTLWFVCFWKLYEAYEFKPAGHITFSGSSNCCCCYLNPPFTVENWKCYLCETSYQGGTWADFCANQSSGRRLGESNSSVPLLASLEWNSLRALQIYDSYFSPATQQHSPFPNDLFVSDAGAATADFDENYDDNLPMGLNLAPASRAVILPGF